MGVGRLGVVDPGDPVDHGDLGDPVRVRAEGPQALADRLRLHAVGAGQRGGGQRVADVVRGRRADVLDRAELGRVLGPVGHERPVHQQAVDHAEVRQGGCAEAEADRPAALLDVGLADQRLGGRVGQVVHAGDGVALVDPALVGGVRLHRAVPVQVVGGQVEHGRRVRAQRGRPVQLVAGELDGEHVVGLLGEHRVQHRDADVADGGGAPARGGQDRGEHLDRGGLAVGAGDRQPGGRFAGGGVRPAQPPGQLDVAPDLQAGPLGGLEQRAARRPAGRGDDQPGALGQGVAVAEADGDAERLQFGGAGPQALAGAAVDDRDQGAEAVQDPGGADAGDAEPGDGDRQAGPVGQIRQVGQVGVGHPVTHPA